MIVVIGISVILFFLFSNNANFDEDESSSAETLAVTDEIKQQEVNDNMNEESVVLIIDIKGEVNDPGVYELPVDARTQDVIDLAGGFTNDADVLQVNLAQKVHDEMAIIVPKEGEELSIDGGQADTSEGEKIQINRASKKDIETLPGIGPSKADAILAYREEIGSFQSEDDLLEIPGIGEKTLENIRDNIQLP